MGLKKENQRMEDALTQLCESLEETIDTKGNTFNSEFEVFAVVQAGLEIEFFEFHTDQSNLDEENIPFKLPQNAKRSRKASEGVPQEPIIDSREATPTKILRSEDNELGVVDRLVMTFDKPLKNPLIDAVRHGPSIVRYYPGASRNEISARQYNITVDGDVCI